MDSRMQMQQTQNYSFVSSFLMGIFFSAGWSPCVGPVLGAILTLAMNGGSISQGLLLLSSYSLGLAIPFLLAALGIGWVSTLLKKFSRIMRITEVVMGSLMVVVGLLLMTGAFNMIAIMFPGWSFGL
jgi:cytochrome c-type biogenesis protein